MKDVRYDRTALTGMLDDVVLAVRPKLTDPEDVRRISNAAAGLILSEFRWLDVCDGVNNARN